MIFLFYDTLKQCRFVAKDHALWNREIGYSLLFAKVFDQLLRGKENG